MNNKFDYKWFLKKIQYIDSETIVNFIWDNRQKILSIVYIVLSVLLVIWSFYYGYETIKVYHKVEDKIKTIEVVKDIKIKNFVKSNKLRTLKTIAATLYVLDWWTKKIDFNKLEDDILNSIIVYRFKIGKDDLNSNPINNFFFFSDEFSDLDFKTKLNILKNIDNKAKLKSILGNNKLVSLIKFYKKKYAKSDDLKNYLNEFPNIWKRNGDKKYNKIADVLKNLYLYEYLFIKDTVKEDKKFLENKKTEYEAPYKYFLTNIYLPSVNIWSDKYSSKIHVDVFGENYLKSAKYIDINLMSYWWNFFKKTYKWDLYWKHGGYNQIQNINIGTFTPVSDKIAKLPIQANLLLKNDKMFYSIISKLTSTSDKKNILLIDEFTFYLWKNIRENIEPLLKKDKIKNPVWYKYLRSLFSNCKDNFTPCDELLNCKWSCDETKVLSIFKNTVLKDKLWTGETIGKLALSLKQNLNKEIGKNFKNSTIYRYLNNEYYNIDNIDLLIWARLNDCIFKDGYCNDILSENGKVIANSIEDFSSCNRWGISNCITTNHWYKTDECNACREKFVRKFDTNYFIPYTLVSSLDKKNYTLKDRLKDVYKNIPDLLELNSFVFLKNGSEDWYSSKIAINVYYKYLSKNELAKILSYIGHKKCSKVTNNSDWSISVALNYINKKVNNLYKWGLDASWAYSLKEKKKIIENLNEKYNWAKNIDKLLYALQTYRIFKESGYCGN